MPAASIAELAYVRDVERLPDGRYRVGFVNGQYAVVSEEGYAFLETEKIICDPRQLMARIVEYFMR